MKNIAFFLLFISLFKGANDDYISIEYAGDTDVDLFVAYISKVEIPRSEMVMSYPYSGMPHNYVVPDKEYLFIKENINQTIKKPFEEKDYTGFKITISENNSVVKYFVSRKNSNSLFLKIIAFLTKNKSDEYLIDHFEKFRTRNVW